MSNSTSQHLGVLSVRSDPEPVDPNEVPLIVSEIVLQQYYQVAVVTVLVYDALITLDKEAKYFWKIPQRAVDYVYFLNRYIGIFGSVAFLFWDVYTVDIALCNFTDWTRNTANWVTIILIDYILMIRVLALYSQNTRLSIFLTFLLVLEAIFKLALMIYLGVIEHIAVGALAKNVTVCGYDNSDPPWRLGMVDWMIPMAYGAILMILALYKAAEYWTMSAGFKGFMLVKVLIRDQVLYFMLVIACCIFDILEFRVEVSNIYLSAILDALGNPALLTILGSRMLFNLKEAGERGQNEGTSYRAPSRTISDIDFAEPAPPQRASEPGIDGDDGET